MPRLFVGNFSFENLASGTQTLPATLLRLEAELAVVWCAVANDGDGILCPESIDASFWHSIRERTAVTIRVVTPQTLSEFQASELVVWGHTPETRNLARRLKLPCPAPDQSVVWQVNSRRYAWESERDLGVQLPGSAMVTSLKELLDHLRDHFHGDGRWILKANFSQSGRDQLRGMGAELTPNQCRWVQRRLNRQGELLVEPFLDRLHEVGVQWEIPERSPVRCVGLTRLLTNAQGEYLGTSFELSEFPGELLESILAAQHWAVSGIQELGYFGPVGIDAMLYRSDGGLMACRPLQDINARWTMGRIAWEWKRRLTGEDSDRGTFRLSPAPPLPDAISLSPEMIGGKECQHRTWWCP